MKKQLEAELISIAHRILKLKNKSELDQLHLEVQKLYEKLSVLKFVEAHFEDVKPTIGRAHVEEKIETAFGAAIENPMEEPVIKQKKSGSKKEAIENTVEKPEGDISGTEKVEDTTEQPAEIISETTEIEVPEMLPESELEIEEPTMEAAELAPAEDINVSEPEAETTESTEEANIEEPTAETNEPVKEAIATPTTQEDIHSAEVKAIQAIAQNNDTFFKPSFELAFDTKEDEEPRTQEATKIEDTPSEPIVFEEFLGKNYVDPVFVKPEELQSENRTEESVIPIGRNFSDSSQVIPLKQDSENQTQTLNERISKGLTIGLNDRIAFMKHLFNNSSEDYNRVLSQLITFDTLSEATNFIDNMVKPDYNNWEGKDEYSQRFIEIIEKKFA